MVEIRVSGKNQAEVEAWVQRVVALSTTDPEAGHVYQSHVRPGRKGDYLVYINICRPSTTQEVVAVRIPRKSSRQPGRGRRRAGG